MANRARSRRWISSPSSPARCQVSLWSSTRQNFSGVTAVSSPKTQGKALMGHVSPNPHTRHSGLPTACNCPRTSMPSIFKAWAIWALASATPGRAPADAGGDHHGQFAAIEAVLVALGKEALQEGLGEAVHGAVGAVAPHHQGIGPADFFRQIGKIVFHLADIVLFAAQTGDAGAHIDAAELDELGFQAAGRQHRLDQAVGVAVFYGAAGNPQDLRIRRGASPPQIPHFGMVHTSLGIFPSFPGFDRKFCSRRYKAD
jgi:hypothetical protein